MNKDKFDECDPPAAPHKDNVASMRARMAGYEYLNQAPAEQARERHRRKKQAAHARRRREGR